PQPKLLAHHLTSLAKEPSRAHRQGPAVAGGDAGFGHYSVGGFITDLDNPRERRWQIIRKPAGRSFPRHRRLMFCYDLLASRRTMKQPVERRLAAILAADVAGYSRLMGEAKQAPRRHCVSITPPPIRSSPSTAGASSRPPGTGCLSSSVRWS